MTPRSAPKLLLESPRGAPKLLVESPRGAPKLADGSEPMAVVEAGEAMGEGSWSMDPGPTMGEGSELGRALAALGGRPELLPLALTTALVEREMVRRLRPDCARIAH